MLTIEGKLIALGALALLLFGVGFYTGHRFARPLPPPAPAVAKIVHDEKASTTTDNKGPTERIVTKYETRTVQVPVPGPPGPIVYRTVTEQVPVERIVEREGPERIVTQAVVEHASSLTITPPPPPAIPGWALQVGFEDVLVSRSLRVAVRRRLFGQLWIEASAVPAQRSLGLAASFAF